MIRSKSENPITLKLILPGFLLLSFSLLILLIRSTFFSSSQTISHLPNNSAISPENPKPAETTSTPPCQNHPEQQSLSLVHTCTKIAPSLATALIHYATTNITPQQTFKEISVSSRILQRKSPCNFLVFGLGHDSLMWTALNHGGRTVFLEENKAWIEQVKEKLPTLEAYHVDYSTRVDQGEDLLKLGMDSQHCKTVSDPRFSKCELAHKGFPNDVYDTDWEVIMVDAPTGYFDGAPGRMTAIYTAGLMARNKEEGETDVFVHDVDRTVEDKFSRNFLCEGYLREQEGRIRHFTIPSHRARSGRPFCPRR